MLETLTAIWKILFIWPCLFRCGDLSVQEAYLSAQAWHNSLNRNSSNTALSVFWSDGKRELWGKQLQPVVAQRVRNVVAEPTLKRMDCTLHCQPSGKFSVENDPRNRLQHFVLFRLAELHVLHDFASYHPALQHMVDGRWCPPPFDAQDAFDDRPGAFGTLTVEISEEERSAMEEILGIVRWNGPNMQRPWEMPDGQEYREWLMAFRAFLSKCPNAWINNPSLNWEMKLYPGLDLLTCDILSPSTPVKPVARVLVGTHLLLAMRAGRLPWYFYNKPELDDLHCVHDAV